LRLAVIIAARPDKGGHDEDAARDPVSAPVSTQDRFAFDLPDEGFFFPGDVIHYYLRAEDTGGGTNVTILRGDTSGFSLFAGDSGYIAGLYPSWAVVRALPSIRSIDVEHGTCTQAEFLSWNDAGDHGQAARWYHAFHYLGFEEGDPYDIYTTNAVASGVYFCFVRVGGHQKIQKLALIR
jgi:hypothetical protein